MPFLGPPSSQRRKLGTLQRMAADPTQRTVDPSVAGPDRSRLSPGLSALDLVPACLGRLDDRTSGTSK
jgi:hypothetical protein